MPKILNTKKLKVKYHDQPRFPVVINGYEKEMKDDYKVTIKKTLKELRTKMDSFTK